MALPPPKSFLPMMAPVAAPVTLNRVVDRVVQGHVPTVDEVHSVVQQLTQLENEDRPHVHTQRDTPVAFDMEELQRRLAAANAGNAAENVADEEFPSETSAAGAEIDVPSSLKRVEVARQDAERANNILVDAASELRTEANYVTRGVHDAATSRQRDAADVHTAIRDITGDAAFRDKKLEDARIVPSKPNHVPSDGAINSDLAQRLGGTNVPSTGSRTKVSFAVQTSSAGPAIKGDTAAAARTAAHAAAMAAKAAEAARLAAKSREEAEAARLAAKSREETEAARLAAQATKMAAEKADANKEDVLSRASEDKEDLPERVVLQPAQGGPGIAGESRLSPPVVRSVGPVGTESRGPPQRQGRRSPAPAARSPQRRGGRRAELERSKSRGRRSPAPASRIPQRRSDRRIEAETSHSRGQQNHTQAARSPQRRGGRRGELERPSRDVRSPRASGQRDGGRRNSDRAIVATDDVRPGRSRSPRAGRRDQGPRDSIAQNGKRSSSSSSSSSSPSPAKKNALRKSIFGDKADPKELANFAVPTTHKRTLYITHVGAKLLMGVNGERLQELTQQTCCSIRVKKGASQLSEFHLSGHGDFERADRTICQILAAAGALDALRGRT